MDLAIVYDLVRYNNGVKNLLVRQVMFDRTMDAGRMKTKDSKNTEYIFNSDYKRNRPNKIWVDQKTEFAGPLKKRFAAEGEQNILNEWKRSCFCRAINQVPQEYTVL